MLGFFYFIYGVYNAYDDLCVFHGYDDHDVVFGNDFGTLAHAQPQPELAQKPLHYNLLNYLKQQLKLFKLKIEYIYLLP